MPHGKLPDGWALEGLWRNDRYTDVADRQRLPTDKELARADAVIISYIREGWDNPEYITVHGVDDWDRLYDLAEDYEDTEYMTARRSGR